LKTRIVLGAWLIVGALAVSAQDARNVWDGVYSEDQAKRGEAVYVDMCANCHGSQLEGIDMSPALAGSTFNSNWNDLTIGDLAERIRISMPADRAGTMSRTQVADVVAFMLKANKFPAGQSDLPQDVPVLKLIRILPEKPSPAH
jgi:S-disulfanyl-L-cysteine oxidoreductase SoxD